MNGQIVNPALLVLPTHPLTDSPIYPFRLPSPADRSIGVGFQMRRRIFRHVQGNTR